MLPLLLLLVFGVVGVHRVAQGKLGVSGVAREAAVAGALGDTEAEARLRATGRGRTVAEGYQLTNGSLRLDVAYQASGRGGEVEARAEYDVGFDDLPLLGGWARVTVSSTHVAPIDAFRSRWTAGRSAP